MRDERTDPSMHYSTKGLVRLSQALSRTNEIFCLRVRFRPGTRTAYNYSNFQYFAHFFQYQYQYQNQNSQKVQYQYQNQYFETVVFNIKININTFKILTFQNFSKFCAMSVW